MTNVTVVIRSSHERTEQLCAHLVKQQVPKEHVVVIHERPFTQALRKSFEIGIEFGLDWTLCLDADILLRTGAVRTLIHRVESQPDTAFGGHGRIFDKLFGTLRYAGPHLYCTSLLPKALNLIPDASVSLRPETYTKNVMASQGHNWLQFDDVMAVHDFEQYYRDVYRKMVVRANKGPEQVRHLMRRAKANGAVDPDFLVCLWGLRVGLSRNEAVLLDARQWDSEIQTLLLAHGLEEKKSLETELYLDLPDKLTRRYASRWTSGRRYTRAGRLLSKTSLRVGSLLEAAGVQFKLWGAT